MNKLSDLDITEFLGTHDIIMLVETWIHSNLDLANVSNKFCEFNHFSTCRRKTLCNRGHGGINLLIRRSASLNSQQIISGSENILWILCNSKYMRVIIGIVYYAPDGSPYAIENTIDILNEELQQLCRAHNPDDICIVGDFNGRIGSSVLDVKDMRDDCIRRTSQDIVINARGRHLLEFCRSSGLIIANGRLGSDCGDGSYTCIRSNGCSVVDYVLANDSFFSKLCEFKIGDSISSDHMPVSFEVRDNRCEKQVRNYSIEGDDTIALTYRKIIWSEESSRYAKLCFKSSDIETSVSQLVESCSANNTDDIVSTLYDIIFRCCQPYVRLPRAQRTFKQHRKCAPWFDKDCSRKKTETRHLLRMFRLNRTSLNLRRYSNCKSEYNVMKKLKRVNNQRVNRDKLLRANNNDFWKLLKEGPRTSLNDDHIPLQYKFEYFSNLYSKKPVYHIDGLNPCIVDVVVPELDRDIITSDVTKAIKDAKPHKAGGIDGVPIDLWKSLIEIHPSLASVMNCLFKNGVYPEEWRTSIIVTLHKSGDKSDLNNYRGLSLLPSISKIYSSIISSRLSQFLESNHLIIETQAGYRPGYSTLDNLLIFDSTIKKFQKFKSPLYCVFVDFKKAFDYVNRGKLLHKCYQIGVSTKVIKYLESVYRNVYGVVQAGPQRTTKPFDSFDGVRQGENISSLLFSIYINDISQFLSLNGATELQVGLLKFIVLLFADDLAIFCKTAKGLQRKLNLLHEFCLQWDLKANELKTKVMVFGKRSKSEPTWFLNGVKLEIVETYSYIGLTFNRHGNWNRAVSDQCNKAKRAIFSLYNNMKQFGNPDPKTMLKLFDSKIKPILLYGCELWGLDGGENIESVASDYYRRLLGLRNNSSTFFARSEMGRLPLSLLVQCRVIKYWLKVVTHQQTAVFKAYCYQKFLASNNSKCWANEVKNLLFSTGFGFIWNNQDTIDDPVSFMSEFSQRCEDIARQEWLSKLNESPLFRVYKTFKYDLHLERYLNMNLSLSSMNYIARLRGCLLKININMGRWRNIPLVDRICPMCNDNEIEDENHVLFHCTVWRDYRRPLLRFSYFRNGNLKLIFSVGDRDFFCALATFIKNMLNFREDVLSVL